MLVLRVASVLAQLAEKCRLGGGGVVEGGSLFLGELSLEVSELSLTLCQLGLRLAELGLSLREVGTGSVIALLEIEGLEENVQRQRVGGVMVISLTLGAKI